MKTCPHCAGQLQRLAAVKSKILGHGSRYKCKACGKSITVRGGEISQQRGRPELRDWRHGVAA